MSERQRFDLIVIGSGPAGEKGAAQAAYFGKKVALIEREPILGGAAANTGTLPSKTLRETSLFLSGFRNRKLYGVDFSIKGHLTVRNFLARERAVSEQERERIVRNLERHGITRFEGTASFVDPHTVLVRSSGAGDREIEGDVILIATGSAPRRPPGIPFEDPRVYDSDEILQLESIPRSMLVVGGGVIGCEYACVFAVLGVQVTLVEKRERLLGFLDAELAEALRVQMEANGVQIRLNDMVAQLDVNEVIRARMESGYEMEPEAVLVSAGRVGSTQGLHLEKAGVEVDARGQIKVDHRYLTSVPHIYAAGDVIGFPALASTSMEQARVAMADAFDLKYKKQIASILPYGIYTIPECSMAGETEESLREKGIPYVVGRASYADNPRGRIIGDQEGFLKLLFRLDDMRLLGVHVIGEQATELIHIGLTALLLDEGADLFIQSCYNYPTLGDLYKYATYHALGQRLNMIPVQTTT